MKKLLLLMSVLFLSACQSIDEEALKEEIKDELRTEFVFDISDYNEHLIALASQAKACTVTVNVTLGVDNETHGSGVIYQHIGNDYYILTNEHVVRYNQGLEVYLAAEEVYIGAVVTKEDAELDLAILKITSLLDLSVCEIEDADYQLGEMVMSVGTPVSIEYASTVTLGIISNITDNLIQHDSAVNPGSSGGPLFNMDGKIIGLNVSKINSTYLSNIKVTVEGIGFAIGLEDIINFIQED